MIKISHKLFSKVALLWFGTIDGILIIFGPKEHEIMCL